MDIPKAFISYSHDNIEHKKWVVQFGSRLRANGVDAILDQWELTPGDDLPHFMEQNLANANFILMICSDRYVSRANQGTGGVGYEKMIITSSLLKNIDESKIIPIVRQNGTYEVPTFLKSKLFIDLSRDDDFEFSFDELIRKIHRAPIYAKPPIGQNPFINMERQVVHIKNSAFVEMMKIIIGDYNNGNNYSKYSDVLEKTLMSRVMFDLNVSEAVVKKYIQYDSEGDLVLLDAGKFYAIDNNLA